MALCMGKKTLFESDLSFLVFGSHLQFLYSPRYCFMLYVHIVRPKYLHIQVLLVLLRAQI